jgi:hypothetical protein
MKTTDKTTNNQKGQFFWQTKGQTEQNQSSNNPCQFAPRDPNAMDTSAMV